MKRKMHGRSSARPHLMQTLNEPVLILSGYRPAAGLLSNNYSQTTNNLPRSCLWVHCQLNFWQGERKINKSHCHSHLNSQAAIQKALKRKQKLVLKSYGAGILYISGNACKDYIFKTNKQAKEKIPPTKWILVCKTAKALHSNWFATVLIMRCNTRKDRYPLVIAVSTTASLWRWGSGPILCSKG